MISSKRLIKRKKIKGKKHLKNVLIICFSLILFFCFGCSIIHVRDNKWETPQYPKSLPVEVVPMNRVLGISDGFWISPQHASNLVDNVDALKAHIEKLEAQIETMKKYYGDK